MSSTYVVNYLYDKHYNQDKDQACVEIGYVESGPEAADQSVASDNSCQEHGSQLRTQIL
jgi:hypothetical protein